jgi:hypothetical protein
MWTYDVLLVVRVHGMVNAIGPYENRNALMSCTCYRTFPVRQEDVP